jgi:DNA-binding IclR family transcriptional regulator
MDSQTDLNDGLRMLRIMRVIEVVGESVLPVSVAQISQRAEIPKATLTRMVNALISSGYLAHVPGSNKIIPGPKSSQMALHVLGNSSFRRGCKSVLREAVHYLGETCNLTARDGDSVMYIERVETVEPLRMHLEPGMRAPLYCTAGGKLFLSQLDLTEIDRYLSTHSINPRTHSTIADKSQLKAELLRLKKLGIGLDNEEFIVGMVGIAVPVRAKKDGDVLAALVCHAASARVSFIEMQKKLPSLQIYAEKIGLLLNSGG